MRTFRPSQRGFTLLEILLVVALIAILAGIVIVAINPSRQLAQARDAQRRVDVNTILSAIYQYALDNNGEFPAGVKTQKVEICGAEASQDCGSLADLTALTSGEKYIVKMPRDPTLAQGNKTGYYVEKSANGRVTVSSVGELDSIEATR